MSVLAFPKPRDIRFIQHGPDMPSLKPFQDCTYILTLTPKTHFKVQRKFHSFLFLQPPIRVSSAAATLTCETDRRWTCDAIKSDLANI